MPKLYSWMSGSVWHDLGPITYQFDYDQFDYDHIEYDQPKQVRCLDQNNFAQMKHFQNIRFYNNL